MGRMERDEILALTCTALLPFLAEISGAAESVIVVATVCYVAAAIVLVQLK
jgi:hypothetical protein